MRGNRRKHGQAMMGMVLAAFAGCGARTGLTTPDVGVDAAMDAPLPFDAPPDTPPDVPVDGCVFRSIALTPIHPEVMFVLDRSTSMSWALTGPAGPGASRYEILRGALASQLPRYDDRLDMGALLYPGTSGSGCMVAPRPQREPAPGNASAVLFEVMDATPGGRTPTADALSAARAYFASHVDPSRPRAVVLSTDGAPNCNASLSPATCPCTGGAGLPIGCGGDSEICLDDARTISVITSLLGDGIPTYVVGIDGDPDPAVSAVLTRMARAGGRPNPLDTPRAFYSVRSSSDLAAAFDRIQASILSCTFSLESPIPAGRAFVVSLDGEVIPRDPSRMEGWEFQEGEARNINLYGDICTRVLMDGEHDLSVELTCGL